MIKTTIVNVVATAILNQKVDLYELGKLGGIIHDPETYGGRVAYFQKSNMRGKVSVFSSGKMISVGARSEEEAYHNLEIVKNFFEKKGIIKATTIKPKTRNIVATVDFGESIDLENLAIKHKSIYEPEQFPGCILKIEEPYKASVLIFSSGKTVVTGLSTPIQIKPVVQKIANIIRTSTD